MTDLIEEVRKEAAIKANERFRMSVDHGDSVRKDFIETTGKVPPANWMAGRAAGFPSGVDAENSRLSPLIDALLEIVAEMDRSFEYLEKAGEAQGFMFATHEARQARASAEAKMRKIVGEG